MKLDNVRLLVQKFDEMFRFYRDVMGFSVTWGEHYAQFQIPEGGNLALFSRSEMAAIVDRSDFPDTAKTQDRSMIVFGVGNVDDFFSSLKEKGAVTVTDPTDFTAWGIRLAHLRDPDGNLFEIMSPLIK